MENILMILLFILTGVMLLFLAFMILMIILEVAKDMIVEYILIPWKNFSTKMTDKRIAKLTIEARAYRILDDIDFKYIENYVRYKKLKKIK